MPSQSSERCPKCEEARGLCDECVAELNEFERKRAALPKRIGLCPEHAPEFYYPLRDDEGTGCPMCSLPMSVYVQETRP